MTTTRQPTGFTLKGWHVLAIFVAFYGVMVAVNTIFIIDAYRTFPGEVSDRPYEDGVAYNQSLRQQAAQAALGWRVRAGMSGPGRLTVEVADAHGAPVDGLRVNAQLSRPATDAGLAKVTLQPLGVGVYQANVAAIHGAWDVAVDCTDAKGREFVADRRIVTP